MKKRVKTKDKADEQSGKEEEGQDDDEVEVKKR